MQVTDIRVRRIAKEGKMKAIVSVTLDDAFVVHDIKVIEGEKGLFIAMPSRRASDGEFRDIAHPINTETREHLQELIFEKYSNYMSYLGGTLGPWRRFETGVDCDRSCLVIGDSFANCFVPFLASYYEYIHVTDVRQDYYDAANARWSISQYMLENGVDDVYFVLSTASGVNTVGLMDNLLRYL